MRANVTPAKNMNLLNVGCSWPELPEQPQDDTTLRHEQIKLRIAEIEAVVDVMDRLSQGEELVRHSMSNAPDFDWERWRHVDASSPVMVGHSLGGSAAVRILSSFTPR